MAYTIFKLLFLPLYKIIYPIKVKGLKNFPKNGPAIVCSNHFSALDPPLVACIVKKRQIFFMAKEELFRSWLGKMIFTALGAFPVKRNTADRQAIRVGLEKLKEGQMLGIFPEGTRSRTGELLTPMAGVGLFALKSGAPVIPVAIKGPYKLFRTLHVVIGEPIVFSAENKKIRGKDMDVVSSQIMDRISQLLKDV